MKPKQLLTQAKKTLVPAAVRGAGVLGGALLANKVFPQIAENLDEKYVGPILFGLGIVGEVIFGKNEMIRNASQGVSAYAVLHTAGAFMPDMKESYGLAGTEPNYATDFPMIDYSQVDNGAPIIEGMEDYEDYPSIYDLPSNDFNTPNPASIPALVNVSRFPSSAQNIAGAEDYMEEKMLENM